jgi:hypothetical protein
MAVVPVASRDGAREQNMDATSSRRRQAAALERMTLYALAGLVIGGGSLWLSVLPGLYFVSKNTFALALLLPPVSTLLSMRFVGRFAHHVGLPSFASAGQLLEYLKCSPFFVAIARWSIALSLWNYLTRYRHAEPPSTDARALHTAFVTAFVVMNVLYAVLCNSSPGLVEKSNELVASEGGRLHAEICRSCFVPRALRSKHCKVRSQADVGQRSVPAHMPADPSPGDAGVQRMRAAV